MKIVATLTAGILALVTVPEYALVGTNTWSVVPEPSFLLLIGAGLVGTANLIRRLLHPEQKNKSFASNQESALSAKKLA
jgi:hypothetical protein